MSQDEEREASGMIGRLRETVEEQRELMRLDGTYASVACGVTRVSASRSKQVMKTRDNTKDRTHAPKDESLSSDEADERRVMIKDRMSNAVNIRVNTSRKTRS